MRNDNSNFANAKKNQSLNSKCDTRIKACLGKSHVPVERERKQAIEHCLMKAQEINRAPSRTICQLKPAEKKLS